MQVWPAGETGIAGLRDELAPLDTLAGPDPDRIPVEMCVQGVGAVVVQDTDQVCRTQVAVGI